MSYKMTSYTKSHDNSGKTCEIPFAVPFEVAEEIFIVFTDLPHNAGRFYGLRSGFGHCFMLYRFGLDWWVVDPLFSGIMHARIQNLSRQGMIDLLLSMQCHIIVHSPHSACRLKSPRFLGRALSVQLSMMSFGVFSCVTLVKRCLGIRKPWLITPFGLYKFFIRTNKENY